MKGILLAGGNGTRLYPSTNAICKQLIPVFDKPMIYYPLSTLMLIGIKDILIISTPSDTPILQKVLGDGSSLGIHLEYKMQEKPKGIPDAFILGKEFIGTDNVCLMLGDNIFYGQGLYSSLGKATQLKEGAVIFGYYVKNPERYGVLEFTSNGEVVGIAEKPQTPKSNYAIPGIYFFDYTVIEKTLNIIPSKRGELEITDVIKKYLIENRLKVELIGRGVAWLDTGTPESLLDASDFIATLEKRQGLKVACIEEVAYRKGFISKSQLKKLICDLPECSYREYLTNLFLPIK